MGFTIRPATGSERLHAWNDNKPRNYAGFIGFARGDFGTSGAYFYASLYDFSSKKAEKEVDAFIDKLHDNGNILESFITMRRFCFDNCQDATFPYGPDRKKYIYRIDNDDYVYILNLCPFLDEYFYIYVYEKKCFDRFIEKANKGIRFITPRYKTLFTVNDGDEVKLKRYNGTYIVKECRYIDETHFYFGNNIYHICEFAEKCNTNGNSVEPVRKEDIIDN